MILILIAHLLMSEANASFWSDFCERYLIADDPYQYEALTVEQLVTAYLTQPPSKALDQEIKKRRLSGDLTYEERQMLKVTDDI